MSLYHAYRPQTFGDIVGQEHIKRTIVNAVIQRSAAHAYLFSGSRGVGKTSIARILAMAVNCDARAKEKSGSGDGEPCGTCQSCVEVRRGANLNVVEIDAASNRGIDEIRALREAVGFAPGKALRKVYIIDEVHMLTKEAFNALLKTLEEPPAHALFILATTELHRVPDTIISRTQHFEFKRASLSDTKLHLERIAKSEKLTVEPEAVDLLALHADGAFRDALSLLDQLASMGENTITAEHVRLLLGIAPEAELLALLERALSGDVVQVHAQLERFAEHGYDPSALSDALITTLRHVLWARYGVAAQASESMAAFAAAQAKAQTPGTIVHLIEALITAKQQLRWTPLPMLPLELALIPDKAVAPRGIEQFAPSAPIPAASTPPEAVPNTPVAPKDVAKPSVARQPAPSKADTAPAPVATASAPSPSPQQPPVQRAVGNTERPNPKPASKPMATDDLPAVWKAVVDKVRLQNASLSALLRSSKLHSLEQTECTIEVPFSFYADRMKDHKNATIITTALEEVTSYSCKLRCALAGTLTAPTSPAADTPARSQDEVARDVMEVFGVETAAANG